MQARPGGGHLKADESDRLQSVIKNATRYGYLPRSISTLSELGEDADKKLFFFSSPDITLTMFCTISCPRLKH